MNIRGLHSMNFKSETEELIAVWSRAPMIYRSGSWEKAPITLTNDLNAEMESFLDCLFLVNGTDDNYCYDESLWHSQGKNTADSPIAKFIKKHSTRLYLFNIKIAGTSYPSRCWFSDLPKNNTITWGLETGTNLAQTASDATITSAGSLFETRNIKVGDPLLITSGTNAGEYTVQSVTSETVLELTENLTNTATGSSFWVGGNWIDIETDDGDEGNGLAITSNEVFLYKKNSVHRFNVAGAELRKIKNMPGTTSSRSIVEGSDGYIYSYYPTGIYRTQGSNGQKISTPIQDVIDGVTDANQPLVVGWEEKRKFIVMHLGNVTLRDGTSITKCEAVFDEATQTWSLRSRDRTLKVATRWLEDDVEKTYAGDDDGGVFELDTGYDFNDEPIPFRLTLHPIYPAGSETTVLFTRLRAYIQNGLDVQIYYKLYYKPTNNEKKWINDADWKPLKGSQRGDRIEWDFPIGSRACGVQLKIIESSTSESFLLQKLVIYISSDSNR